jgi:Gpi18-like mannosyltransferase
MINLSILKNIIPLYIGWTIILLLIVYFGVSVIPSHGEKRVLEFADSETNYLIKWANWDGGHFRGIAENGYIHSFQVVFFPLYPLLIKDLMLLGLSSLWAGLIISHVSTIFALYFLYKLVLIDYKEDVAKKAVFLLLVFPTGFYLISVYSESLFLALGISSIYFARKKKWLLASILAGLSAITRIAGVGIIIAVAVEYFLKEYPEFKISYLWKRFLNRLILYSLGTTIIIEICKNILIQKKSWIISGVLVSISYYLGYLIVFFILFSLFYFLFKYTSWKKFFTLNTLYIFLSITPLIFYMIYLKQTQGDFFAFVNHENNWGRALTFPWEAPINLYNTLSKVNFFRIGGSAQALIEFLFFLITLFTFIYSALKFRVSYTLFFALAIILPLSTGTLQAIHRYSLIAFPMIIALSLVKNETIFRIWLIFSLVFLGLFSVMFFNGYWVT